MLVKEALVDRYDASPLFVQYVPLALPQLHDFTVANEIILDDMSKSNYKHNQTKRKWCPKFALHHCNVLHMLDKWTFKTVKYTYRTNHSKFLGSSVTMETRIHPTSRSKQPAKVDFRQKGNEFINSKSFIKRTIALYFKLELAVKNWKFDEEIVIIHTENLYADEIWKFSLLLSFNTLRPKQNCRHFADAIFPFLKISLKFLPKVWIDNIPALVQIIVWPVTSNYLNQWWLIYLPIYRSFGLNQLNILHPCSNRHFG